MLLRSALVACFVVLPAAAQTPVLFPAGPSTMLGQQIAAITTGPAVVRAHWGIAVTSIDGTPIYGMNEGEFFRPASNAKLFTTTAAMHLLGPRTTVKTVVLAPNRPAADGVLHGDISLSGGGDANLSGRAIPYVSNAERRRLAAASGQPLPVPDPLRYIDDLAAKVAAAGVKRVTGNVVGDDTQWPWEPYAQDWSIDDAVWGYGAPVSALTVNDNQLELTIEPGGEPGKPATAKLFPLTSYYTVQINVKTVAAKQPASIRIDRSIGSRVFRVVGTVAAGEPYEQDVAIEDPAEFAALAFKSALEAHGIAVDGKAVASHKAYDDTHGFSSESHVPLTNLPKQPSNVGPSTDALGYTIAEHISPSMTDDVTVTLKVSQNLHAEMLLRRLGGAYGTEATVAQGARVVRQFLLNAGLDGDDFMFYDGSGLSGHDLVTPRATAKLLSFATQQPWFAQWKAGLPVGGEDGTLAGRFPKAPLKDHLFAKTGTLSEARALSGYVDCASGKTVIFSVMVDNHAPNTPADREAMDAIVAAIAANN
jgi:D-alanyl-D-alanine carboxypeptidase/D-alanyl-D-alanine-endopeptidase (penicillin-binding protein 4)